MFAHTDKPDMGARLYSALIEMSSCSERGTDMMQLIEHLSGVLVETYFVFEDPDCAMEGSFHRLALLLGCEPMPGSIDATIIPPSYIIDHETERGRNAARIFFEEWLDCGYEFHDMMLSLAQQMIIHWEDTGVPRAESFRLLIECTKRAMAYEIAAQELCDVAIDLQVARKNWSLGDCIAALSAVAGRRVALSVQSDACEIFKGAHIPDNLDHMVYVMTQEAVRLGVPAGSDWRFGLAANDMPVNAPEDLIEGIEPICRSFFDAIQMFDHEDQAVCCAKAAGRMIAVASGGDLPELEPAIAKPLAMAAMTESYKSVCMTYHYATV